MVCPFQKGIAFVELNENGFCIDKTGEKIPYSEDFEEEEFYDGLTTDISDDHLYGFKNKQASWLYLTNLIMLIIFPKEWHWYA